MVLGRHIILQGIALGPVLPKAAEKLLQTRSDTYTVLTHAIRMRTCNNVIK